MLFEDYGELYDRVVEMIAKKTRLTRDKVERILRNLKEKDFDKKLEEILGNRIRS